MTKIIVAVTALVAITTGVSNAACSADDLAILNRAIASEQENLDRYGARVALATTLKRTDDVAERMVRLMTDMQNRAREQIANGCDLTRGR